LADSQNSHNLTIAADQIRRQLGRMKHRNPWARARMVWPMALLLAGITAMAVVAVQAYGATRSHGAMLGRVLADYAKFASWSYEQHLEEMLRSAAREVLGPVNHDPGVHVSPEYPHAADLATYMQWDDACGCRVPQYGPIPTALLSFQLGTDTIGAAPNGQGGMEEWQALRKYAPIPPMPAERAAARYAWVNDTVTRRVRAGYRSETGFPLIVRMKDGAPTLIGYTLMPTEWGDTMVYAVEYSGSAMLGAFEMLLERRDLLPPSLTQRLGNRDVLMVEVRAATGELLFGSDTTSDPWLHDSRITMPDDYGSLSVRTGIRPAMAGALVIGGVPASQLPLLLGLLGLAAALTLVAVSQLTRATALSRDRAQFVASVSHELRTPLAQVRLFLDTLRLGRADTAESREWSFDQIDRETRRLVHLVDNVLLFSRGAGTLLDAPRAPLDLGAEARVIIDEFAPLAASRRVRFATEIEDDVVIEATRDAVRHVLLNLLDNAVKYGPTDQTVTVTVRRCGTQALLEVADQGPGIPDADRRRIWQPFQRGSGRSAAAAGGSGIGLHLVHELVTGLDGEAGLRSHSAGATFFVTLPLSSS
jgi:signal transduction histidine kinase